MAILRCFCCFKRRRRQPQLPISKANPQLPISKANPQEPLMADRMMRPENQELRNLYERLQSSLRAPPPSPNSHG